MKISCNSDIKIIGLGLYPWTRIGPLRWLPNYRIVSWYPWDVDGAVAMPPINVVGVANTPPQDIQTIVSGEPFAAVMRQLPDYRCLLGQATPVPPRLAQRVLTNDPQVAQLFGNKADFRILMGDRLPFAPFAIFDRAQLEPNHATLQRLMAGRDVVIVQDELLSSGRGTFVVRDQSDLARALTCLSVAGGGRRVVVSEYITPSFDRSVQAVVTRNGIFVGPLQKQIIAKDMLASSTINDKKFMGAEIGGPDRCAAAYPEIRRLAMTIGQELQTRGYKGIFGLDCLVDVSGRVFVLEVNPRLTGITPLLTMLYRGEQDIPFYLLHILELGGYDYTLHDTEVDKPAAGSMIHLVSSQKSVSQLVDVPRSGLYAPDLTFKKPALWLDPALSEHQLLVAQLQSFGSQVQARARILSLYQNALCLDNDDTLQESTQRIIDGLQGKVSYAEV